MKTTNVYPDWVEKYRGKGKTIRKVRNGYGLYKCTSVYVKGSKNPKSKQEYLGMITEKDGFVPKKVVPAHPEYYEYGLSHFIMLNFKRDIMRSSYSSNNDFVILAIIQYIFGSIDPVFIRATWISRGIEDELIDYSSKISDIRINNISKRIDKLIISALPDENDRNIVIKLLFLTVREASNTDSVTFPQEVIDILKRNGLKYE